MPEVTGQAVSDADLPRVWSYLTHYENWLRDLEGYEGHAVGEDGTIVVTMRGKVGFMTKQSRLLVTITEQSQPKITFAMKGLDDPVSGGGELLCEPASPSGTRVTYKFSLAAEGMAAPLINQFLEVAIPQIAGDLSTKIADRLAGRSRSVDVAKTSASSKQTRRKQGFLTAFRARAAQLLQGRQPGADEEYDIVVIGSGGAGLTAALIAHDLGARVVIIEKSAHVGGTFAYSTGLTWVPNNPHMVAEGVADSREDALTYIRPRTTGRHDEDVLQAFIDRSPQVIAELEKRGVPFEIVKNYPDEQSAEPGGRSHGRYLSSPLFHAPSVLGPEWAKKLVRSPNFGVLPMSWSEVQNAGGFGSMARWDWDMLAQRMRDDYRAFGMSTAGYLLAAVLKRGIPIRTETAADSLRQHGGRVAGVNVLGPDGPRSIAAKHGVVLATGSYDNSPQLKRRLEQHPTNTVTLGAATVDGSGLVMALEIGASFAVLGGQLLIPSYGVPGEESEGAPVFRMLARESGLPGSMIVNRSGQRFCDESTITDLRRALALLDPHTRGYPNLPAYFVFDQKWKQTYPLGSIMPGPAPGWMPTANSAAELARQLNIDEAAFEATFNRYNEHAAQGEDPDLGRGSTAFSRVNGDPSVKPNPCLRPLQAPLHAIELRIGIVGNNGGLLINGDAQVMHLRGHAIEGLYAAGNAAANQIGGLWYNAGLMNARGMTFGYLGVHHALGIAPPSAESVKEEYQARRGGTGSSVVAAE